MPTTSYTDPVSGFDAWALQARTDSAGVATDDADGEDARLVASLFTGGVVGASDYQVTEDSPAAMTVVVGSGTANSDLAVVEGTASGQGNYLARNADATTDVTITAADASNPRIDEIYLVIQDNAYDSSGNVLPRIGYRQGDAASSPSAPGPDAAWDAYLKLATVAVGAGVTSITNADITDGRVTLGPSPAVMGAWEVEAFDESQTAEAGVGDPGTTLLTATLSIPEDWNTWKVAAWASAAVTATSGNDVTIGIQGLAGSGGNGTMSVAGTGARTALSAVFRNTGRTVTGDVPVTLLGVVEGGGTGTFDFRQLYVRAVRTS